MFIGLLGINTHSVVHWCVNELIVPNRVQFLRYTNYLTDSDIQSGVLTYPAVSVVT